MNYDNNKKAERQIAKRCEKLMASHNRSIPSKKLRSIEGETNFSEEINEYLKNGGRVTKFASRFAEGYNAKFANLHTTSVTGEDDQEQSSYYAGVGLYFRSGSDSYQE